MNELQPGIRVRPHAIFFYTIGVVILSWSILLFQSGEPYFKTFKELMGKIVSLAVTVLAAGLWAATS